MEAHGVRDYPPASGRGRFVRKAIRAAVADSCAGCRDGDRLADIARGAPVTRDLCGTSMTYLHARTHCGTVDVDGPRSADADLGAGPRRRDMRALDDLYARLVWVHDGDNDAPRRLRTRVPRPSSARSRHRLRRPVQHAASGRRRGRQRDGRRRRGGAADDAGDGRRPEGPTVGSLRDAVAEALDAAAAGQLEQLNEDVSLQDLLAAARDAAPQPAEHHATGTGRRPGTCPTAASTARRCPTRSAAVRYTTRMRRARQQGKNSSQAHTRPGLQRPPARPRAGAAPEGRAGHQPPVVDRAERARAAGQTARRADHRHVVVDAVHGVRAGVDRVEAAARLLRLRRAHGDRLFGNGCELLTDGANR